MKNSRMKTTAVLLTTAFMLSGCGEDLYVLTPEEEDVIVNYAAHAVAKYNTFQQDGEVFVYKEVLEGVEDTEEAETTEVETELSLEVEPEENTQSTESVQNAGEMQNTEGIENQDGTEAAMTENAQLLSTLTEALDLGVIDAEYTGYELCTAYEHSDSYTVDATPGKQLLVMKVRLKNKIEQPLHIDILAMTPEFRAVINGTDTYAAQTTILLNDLSTYQADIEANAVNDTILVFEVPQDMPDVSDIKLKVTMNSKNFEIQL